MEIKKIVSISLIVAAASSAPAQELILHRYVLTPSQVIQGITYERVREILGKERFIEYGEPLVVQINKEENSVDLSDFDGWTVRVPLEVASTQPNKVDADK